MQIPDMAGKVVNVSICYIDFDQTTVLHEKNIAGTVHHADSEQGIAIAVDGNAAELVTVPPSLQAWTDNADKTFTVRWAVFRTQSNRADGQHEWWEWKPQ